MVSLNGIFMQMIKWNIRAHIEQVSTKIDIIYFPNIIGNGLTIHDTLHRNLHSTTRSFGDKNYIYRFVFHVSASVYMLGAVKSIIGIKETEAYPFVRY